MRYYLSMGSNIENRLNYLETGLKFLKSFGELAKISDIYETEPWGVNEIQDHYLNISALLVSELTPEKLLKEIKHIESKLGRDVQTGHMLPRELDIDILFCDNLVINMDGLKIPHPEIENRKFVLIPLCDIDPVLLHPVLGKTIQMLLGECEDRSKIRKFPAQFSI